MGEEDEPLPEPVPGLELDGELEPNGELEPEGAPEPEGELEPNGELPTGLEVLLAGWPIAPEFPPVMV